MTRESTIETFLTGRRGPARLDTMMTPLSRLLRERISEIETFENRAVSIQTIADRCGLDFWIVRDTLLGKSKRPRSEHLAALAKGLGLDSSVVIIAANTPATTPAATPAS